MVETLRPGRLHGEAIKTLHVAGFILTETFYHAHSKLPRHAHENSYFCFVLNGAYTEQCASREIVCTPASVTFRPSGETHEAVLHDAGARIFVMEIPSRWIDKLRANSLALKSSPDFVRGPVPGLCARLNREFHRNDSAAHLAVEGLALELLAEGSRQSAKSIGIPPAWLRQAREMISEHFRETLTLDRIAAHVGVHPVYLATAFRQKYGLTVGDYVRKLRIEQACADLMSRKFPLAEIALRAGFVDQSHFSKVFKSCMGTTPAKYRTMVCRH